MFDKLLFNDITDVLKSDLGLELSTSDLRVYSYREWDIFQKTRGYINKYGVFKPRFMTAHVLDSSISNIIHEHIGHRIFFEHSELGLELRRLESELANLEDGIVSGNLKSGSLQLVYSPLVKQRTIQNKNDNILVTYNDDDLVIKNYLAMSQGVKVLSNKHIDTIESFADWITDFLLRRLQLDKTNKVYANNPMHSEKFDRLLKLESIFGPLSSIYDCGIRKSSNPEIMVSLLKEHLKDDYNSIKYIFQYGSDRPFSDRDFLAVVKNKDADKFNRKVFPNYLDVSFSSEKDFIQGLRYNDLHYTIPLHSGKILKGDIDKISNYKDLIGRIDPTFDGLYSGIFKDYITPSEKDLSLCRKYFVDRKQLALKYSYDFFMQSQLPNTDITSSAKCVYNALTNLSYAISYNYDIESSKTLSFCKDQKYFDAIVADESSDLSRCRKLIKNICVQNYIPITHEYVCLFNKIL